MTLPNPVYYKMIRRNPRLKYSLSKNFKYYEVYQNNLVIPRGCYQRVLRACENLGIDLEVEDLKSESKCQHSSTIKLRNHQQGIPESYRKAEEGIFRCGTGFGKTVLALKLAELTGQKTLIIVFRGNIFNQFVVEVEKYFGYKPGIIKGNKCEIKGITIGMIGTLRNRLDVIDPNEFGLVIYDECHTAIPDKTREVAEFFNSKYRYGMTGTCDRTDGRGEAISFIFGDILVDKDYFKSDPIVHITPYTGHILMSEYYEIVEDQVNDDKRNEMIVDIIQEEVNSGRKILVLTKRIFHYEIIAKKLKDRGVKLVDTVVSGVNEKETKEKMEAWRKGTLDFNCICATTSIFAVGTDIPRLDTLVIACEMKSHVLLQQASGRILRLFEGKPTPKIIDVWDMGNPILKNQGVQRQKTYKKLGWEIKL